MQEEACLDQLNLPNRPLVGLVLLLPPLLPAQALVALELLRTQEAVSLAARRPSLASALVAPRQLRPLVLAVDLAPPQALPVAASLAVRPSQEVSLLERPLGLALGLALEQPQVSEPVVPLVRLATNIKLLTRKALIFHLLGFGAAAAPATAPPAAQSSTIQQHLLSLAASPYGENPLFKSMLSDSNRRQEVSDYFRPWSTIILHPSLHRC